MRHLQTVSLSLLTCFVLGGCGSGGTHGQDDGSSKVQIELRRTEDIRHLIKTTHEGKQYPLKIVCTTGMIADLAKNVGRRHVSVTTLMERRDPHTYKPSSGDNEKLMAADVVFYNGLHLEGHMDRMLDRAGRRKPVFAVAEFFSREHLRTDENGAIDPHVWFDVEMWNHVRGVVQEVLIRYDPEHADDYKQWGDHYKRQLDHLHAEITSLIEDNLPKDRRILVTAHDAFGYFGRKYGFTVKGIQGISTASEPDLAHIEELVDFLVKHKVKAVFVESTVPKKRMQAIIEGCAERGHKVKVGGELFSDAMGAPGEIRRTWDTGTYTGMIRYNVETIVSALK